MKRLIIKRLEAKPQNDCQGCGCNENLVALRLYPVEILILCPVCFETLRRTLELAMEGSLPETERDACAPH